MVTLFCFVNVFENFGGLDTLTVTDDRTVTLRAVWQIGMADRGLIYFLFFIFNMR